MFLLVKQLRSGSPVLRPFSKHHGLITSQSSCSTILARRSFSAASKKRTANEVRKEFLQYFERNGHKVVGSDKLIPTRDPSLLFTNAGMVQFKDYFLGVQPVASGSEQITTVQKCIRVGGKHNDLDNVGKTARHLTFFEMLGNFSFGAYNKERAIDLAWTFLVKQLQLPLKSLRVTVHEDDQESFDIWHKKQGLPLDRIIKGKEDNFWSMGEEPGPCGPCTEIFFDQEQPDSDGDRWLEIWNLVFMQYHKDHSGALTPLKTPCVDTGMGLERLCSVLQGEKNNFDIDSFRIIIDAAKKLKPSKPHNLSPEEQLIALRVIADHVRAASFLIADGVTTSNVGRGYILRRILRRAIRYGYLLGFREPFLSLLYPCLLQAMGEAYPGLQERGEVIQAHIYQEEKLFFDLLVNGMKLLDHTVDDIAKHNKKRTIPAETAFKLYESYGFPLDLTSAIASEQKLGLNHAQVEKLLDEHKAKSRRWKAQDGIPPSLHQTLAQWKSQSVTTRFVGYETETELATIKAFAHPEHESNSLWLAIDPCPFYGESGGQVGDQGTLRLQPNGPILNVVNAIIAYEGCSAVQVKGSDHLQLEGLCQLGSIAVGASVLAQVNSQLRQATKRNHTATHLLHSALQNLLGKSVSQAGSLVTPDKLRFDFTHANPLTDEETDQLEKSVLKVIQASVPVQTVEMDLDTALKSGAQALFSEKYGSTVRVIDIPGFSKELCGGTHVSNTSDLQAFKITSERSVASGTRRIEAVTGQGVLDWYTSQHAILLQAAQLLGVKPFQVVEQLQSLLTNHSQAKKDLGEWRSKLIESSFQTPQHTGTYDGVPVALYYIPQSLEKEDLRRVRKRAEALCQKHPSVVHIVISTGADKTVLVVADDLQNPSFHASGFVQRMPSVKGGGSKKLSQGQYQDLSSLKTWLHQNANIAFEKSSQ